MLEHERRVDAGRRPVAALHSAMLDDLDPVRSGIGWWHAYPGLDPAALIFASDYLVQITGQAGIQLGRAAWNEVEFGQAWYGETVWMRGQAGTDGMLPRRDEQALKRDERIGAALAGFFHNCGSVLDALAGAAIGVLGLRADLVTASWSTLAAAAGPAGSGRERFLAAAGTPARQIQDDALAVIAGVVAAGPHGWLPWTLDMRNMLTHRAHRFNLRWSYPARRRGDRLDHALHLPRNPQLTDAEAFVLGSRMEDLLLWEPAEVTMAGVRTQLVDLAAGIAGELEAVWMRRRADPALVPQPAEQWRKVYPTRRDLSQFAGFGPPLPSPESEVRVAPETARRFRAARVTDQHRDFWVRTLAGDEPAPGGSS